MFTQSLVEPLLVFGAKVHARRQFRKFIQAAEDAVRTQERVLRAMLAQDADSIFGRAHHFDRIRTYKDFVDHVPVGTYEDFRPYVERMMAGETTALLGSGRRVLMFAMTSGSVDQPKYLPVTSEFLSEYRRGWSVFGIKAMLDHPSAWLRMVLQVSSPMEERRTESGIPCGSISGLIAGTQQRLVRKCYVCPPEVSHIADPDARYYTIMRLAVPTDLGWIVTASPATQLRLARTAAAHAERLIRDIHDGTLCAPGPVAESIRSALASRITPNPTRARQLDEMARRHGELLPKHYWSLALLANWTGGTMGLHLRDFPRHFGDTPVRDIGLMATEGRITIPLADGTPAGVLDVTGSFFEFVDVEADTGDNAAIHRGHELAIGREYRVVMTTSAGFYRYDIGDHVRVHDFVGRAPVIEFLHRGAHVSSITGEKLTERQVVLAFERMCDALGQRIDTSKPACLFVLAPVWSDPPYYRLHLDVPLSTPGRAVDLFDRELSRLNIEYGSKRHSARLGAVVLHQLAPGTLARVDAERLRRRGGSNEQYKHKYLLTAPGEEGPLLPVEGSISTVSQATSPDEIPPSCS